MTEEHDIRFVFERTPGCPSVEELAAFLEAEEPAGNSILRQHVLGCPHCQSELALLETYEKSTATDSEEEDLNWIMARFPVEEQTALPVYPSTERDLHRPEKGAWWRRFEWFRPTPVLAGLAALLLLGLGIRVLVVTPPELREPGRANGSGAMRGSEFRILTPLGEVSALPESLEWAPVEGAARYEVVVDYVDGTEAARFSSVTAFASWPESVRVLAVPGRTFFIEVEAFAGDGNRLAASEREALHLGVLK